MQIPMHSFRSSLQIDFPPLNMPYQECKRKRFIGFQSSLNENCEVKVVPLHILKVYEYVESWGTDPLIRNLGCSGDERSASRLSRFKPWKVIWYPFIASVTIKCT